MSTEPKIDTESGVFRILIVGGMVLIVLLLFAVCAGVGYFFFIGTSSGRSTAAFQAAQEKEAQTLGMAFLADIKSGNAQAAFRRTTGRFQKQQPLGEFQAQVAQHGWLQGFQPKDLKMTSLDRTMFTGTAVWTGPDGETASISVDLIKDGDGWKVDNWSAERGER